MAKRGIIVGGGAFGREVLDWVANSVSADTLPRIEGFLDADANVMDRFPELGLALLGDPATYQVQPGDVFVMAIGSVASKAKLAALLEAQDAEFLTVIHRTAVVASTAKLGKGVVIGPLAYIGTHAVLGDYSCVNSLTGIGHDAVLGAYTTISSQVDVTGMVRVGERSFIGSGARILPSVSVGEDTRIGAGSVVVRNVKPGSTLFAAPARKI